MRCDVSGYSLYVQLFCCHDNGPIFTSITLQLIFIYLSMSARHSKPNAHFTLWHIAIPISFVSWQGAVSFLIHISCARVLFNNYWSNTSMDKKITFLLLHNFSLHFSLLWRLWSNHRPPFNLGKYFVGPLTSISGRSWALQRAALHATIQTSS
jgi:hypothetical protein